jgi:RHS repeat-associated protein
MQRRRFESEGYRYGFNGKENDNEVKGSGNQVAFEARIYDPRLGRFFSTDPKKDEYPWQSTYAYHRNNFIAWIDYLGGGDPPTVENGVYFVKLKNPTAEIVYNRDLFSFTHMMSGRYDNSSTTDYTVNLQQYRAPSLLSHLRAWSPAMGGNDYVTMGQNVQDGKVTGDATDNKRGYFSQSKDGKWQGGLGNPPAGSAVGFGGGIPIIVGGKKYSSTAHDEYLEAEGYGRQNSTSVGKVIIGLNSKDNSMILVVSPDELKTGGMTLDAIRDRLAGQGYDYVFGFDGGSSSTLIQDGDKKLVTPVWYKDNTIPAGVTLTEK